MSRIQRFGAVCAATIIGLLLSFVVAVQPVGAGLLPIRITGDVVIRGGLTVTAPPLIVMPAGSQPNYYCYERGENVGGTNLWFKVTFKGVMGFYTSYADDVPLTKQTDIEHHYGLTRCGSLLVGGYAVSSSSDWQPPPGLKFTYNRRAAVSWAERHYRDPQPRLWPGCTWFVSQALWAGGYLQTDAWNGRDAGRGTVRKLPGTVTATAAPDLVDFLLKTGRATSLELDQERFRKNAVPEARIGDVIAYKWDGKNVSHLALVVRIAPGNYPEVAEWGTVDFYDPDMRTSYYKRGWTWSQKNSAWLQDTSKRVSAVLLKMSPVE